MSVSKRTRYEVLRRDGHRCRYCGLNATEAELTVDHVTPVALGGSDYPDNLVAACKDCNAGKTSAAPDASLVADVADDAIRWARAMAVAAQEAALAKSEREKLFERFTSAWTRWKHPDKSTAARPEGWSRQIENWLNLGLTMEILVELVDVTLGNSKVDDCWRYFAGCCWTRLTELQNRATEIVKAEETIAGCGHCGWCRSGEPCGIAGHPETWQCQVCSDPACMHEIGYSTGWNIGYTTGSNKAFMRYGLADLGHRQLTAVIDGWDKELANGSIQRDAGVRELVAPVERPVPPAGVHGAGQHGR